MQDVNIVKLKEIYGDVLWAGKKRRLGLPISLTTYILTSKKLFTKVGFFNIREDNIDIYKITDYSLLLSFGQRIFKCGTIKINSRDTDTPEKLLVSVKEPRFVYNTLQETVENERSKYAVRGRDMFGAARWHGGDLHDHDLHDHGVHDGDLHDAHDVYGDDMYDTDGTR